MFPVFRRCHVGFWECVFYWQTELIGGKHRSITEAVDDLATAKQVDAGGTEKTKLRPDGNRQVKPKENIPPRLGWNFVWFTSRVFPGCQRG